MTPSFWYDLGQTWLFAKLIATYIVSTVTPLPSIMNEHGEISVHSVFCTGCQKGSLVPSEKGTFSATNGPLKGHN